MSGELAPCPHCGDVVPADDAFCEACGRALVTLAPQQDATVDPSPCTRCGAGDDAVDADGYCSACGNRRRGQPRDHLTARLTGAVAVSDRGMRHRRNEDAFALARHDGRGLLALVVCDGVSSASRSDEAAQAAADAACRQLATVGADATSDEREAAFTAAVGAAQRVVTAVPWSSADGGSAPSCTFVGALVGPTDATIGWVGDSRAYWVHTDVAEPLTVDHSWAAEQIASGRDAATVMQEPGAHAITRWIGSDQSGDPEADVRTVPLPATGRLLLCSDGLWNLLDPAVVARIVADHPSDDPAAAEALVASANESGGPDNITVIICDPRTASAPVPPSDEVQP